MNRPQHKVYMTPLPDYRPKQLSLGPLEAISQRIQAARRAREE